MSKSEKFIIFTVNGGAGKNVLATAVVKAIKRENPETNIIVLTAYRDIWLYNTNIYRVYNFGNTPHFYEDFVKDKDVKIFALEPYSTTDYLLKRKHLIDIWCELCGVTRKGEMPEIFFNQREVDFFKNNFLQNSPPIFLIQTNGGLQTDIKISWMRDLPLDIAQQVVEVFKNNFRVIQIRREDQPALNDVETFKGNIRELALLIRFSERRLFIDSVSQHLASALGKQSTVTWVRNAPEVLGYTLHTNIVTEVQDEINVLANSVLDPYEITGNVYQCPFKEGTKLFDVNQIIESIKSQATLVKV